MKGAVSVTDGSLDRMRVGWVERERWVGEGLTKEVTFELRPEQGGCQQPENLGKRDSG